MRAQPDRPIPADAERLARLVTAFPGPLADELVLPWALGAGDVASWNEVALTDGVSDPASAIAEARALAADATAEVWGMPPPEARERAADVARLLLQGRVTDGMRTIAGLRVAGPGGGRPDRRPRRGSWASSSPPRGSSRRRC